MESLTETQNAEPQRHSNGAPIARTDEEARHQLHILKREADPPRDRYTGEVLTVKTFVEVFKQFVFSDYSEAQERVQRARWELKKITPRALGCIAAPNEAGPGKMAGTATTAALEAAALPPVLLEYLRLSLEIAKDEREIKATEWLYWFSRCDHDPLDENTNRCILSCFSNWRDKNPAWAADWQNCGFSQADVLNFLAGESYQNDAPALQLL